MKANEILAKGNEILAINSNNRKSIYKKELFAECKTDKEKKALRIKLRKKLYNLFATFLQVEKNPQKLNELKKLWKDYAKNVYLDVSDIIENNAKDDNIKLAKRFLSVMSK